MNLKSVHKLIHWEKIKHHSTLKELRVSPDFVGKIFVELWKSVRTLPHKTLPASIAWSKSIATTLSLVNHFEEGKKNITESSHWSRGCLTFTTQTAHECHDRCFSKITKVFRKPFSSPLNTKNAPASGCSENIERTIFHEWANGLICARNRQIGRGWVIKKGIVEVKQREGDKWKSESFCLQQILS